MIRPVLLWPDPVLSTPCAPVTSITEEIRTLAADMLESMYAAPGRGLAAPQVGVSLRLFVMDTTWKDGTKDPVVMVNPEIIAASEARITGPEGCLSIPGVVAQVERAETVRMRWTSLDGDACEKLLDGFAAICAQHELDHLDGLVTFDRIASEARAELERTYAA